MKFVNINLPNLEKMEIEESTTTNGPRKDTVSREIFLTLENTIFFIGIENKGVLDCLLKVIYEDLSSFDNHVITTMQMKFEIM